MPKLRNWQEAFDAAMKAMTEALEVLNPPASRELAAWHLEVTKTEKTVASFSTCYTLNVQLLVGVKFKDGSLKYFAKSLS